MTTPVALMLPGSPPSAYPSCRGKIWSTSWWEKVSVKYLLCMYQIRAMKNATGSRVAG